jgi:hypothetical protein
MYWEIFKLNNVNSLHLIQDHIKVNNFGKAHPCKFLLDSKLYSSKVGTLKQILDLTQIEILQIFLILNTTTTSVCL